MAWWWHSVDCVDFFIGLCSITRFGLFVRLGCFPSPHLVWSDFPPWGVCITGGIWDLIAPLLFLRCACLARSCPRTARPVKNWGRCACAQGWITYLQGRKPHHGAHCDVTWWGRPPCSRWHGKSRILPHSRRNGLAGQVDWLHSAGRGDSSIPAPLTPSHWQFRLT